MAKPKPDHREQVEVKFGAKERRLLDDLQLNQSFKTGGALVSDLTSGISSIISPFLSGGDAGLLMALLGSFVVDSKLDDKTEVQLGQFLNSIQLYPADAVGAYPSTIPQDIGPFFGLTGTPVIFCNPLDFPELPNRWSSEVSVPVSEFFSDIPPLSFSTIHLHQWTQINKQRFWEMINPRMLPGFEGNSLNDYIEYCRERGLNDIPWMTLIPATDAATYSSTPPTIEDIQNRGLSEKYNLHQLRGEWEPYTVTVWDHAVEAFQIHWENMPTSEKILIFLRCGGSRREQLDSLGDLLAAINLPNIPNMIPSMSSIIGYASGPAMRLSGAVESAAEQQQNMQNYTASLDRVRPYCVWPAISYPPKSIYKYETLHTLIEAIKIGVPWYLGTKLAIQAAGAAGSIIPG
jgi:hypothetical protein